MSYIMIQGTLWYKLHYDMSYIMIWELHYDISYEVHYDIYKFYLLLKYFIVSLNITVYTICNYM